MSRVYFHSPSATAELAGSERAYLGSLCHDVATGLLHLDGPSARDRLAPVLNPRLYAAIDVKHKRDPFLANVHWERNVRTGLHGFSTSTFAWKNKPIDAFQLVLNSAVTVGNDALRLAARIHGQCEIHAYIEGLNRAWVAGIMQAGLDAGIYRKGLWYEPFPYESARERKWAAQGWENVITFLRSRDDEPIVMSYSVCEWFPNRYIANWAPDIPADWRPEHSDGWDEHSEDEKAEIRDDQAAEEMWYSLPDRERWDLAMAGLRANTGGLEIKPDDWSTFRFGHGLSVLDLDRPERLDAALLG